MIEAFLPDPGRFSPGRLSVRAVELDSIRTEVSRHDRVVQTFDGQAIELGEQGARFFPFRIRYAWSAELDLMARLAGLQLRARWGGWGGELSPRRASNTSRYTSAESVATTLEPKRDRRTLARRVAQQHRVVVGAEGNLRGKRPEIVDPAVEPFSQVVMAVASQGAPDAPDSSVSGLWQSAASKLPSEKGSSSLRSTATGRAFVSFI